MAGKVKKKEKHIWHPIHDIALILGMAIIVISLLFEFLTTAGILIAASIVASTIILTHKYRHHLTTLGTIIFSYFIAGILSIGLVSLLRIGGTHMAAQVFIVLFAIGWVLYWLNLFHPPAISFGLAFVDFQMGGIGGYLFVLLSTIVFFSVIRLFIYTMHEHLSIRDFIKEFVREEEEILKAEEKKLKQKIKKI